jgi:hypothetical protein
MEYLIQQFLKQNNLTGINGVNYSLRDDGEGVYIDKWNYEIAKPQFTDNQINNAKLPELLQQAKDVKLAELKTKLNADLINPNGSHKAEELLVDELQQEIPTNKQVYFLFKTKATGIPVTEPDTLLGSIINDDNPNYYLPYFCTIVEGDVNREGFVKITKAVAKSIRSHMTVRATAAVSYLSQIKSSIMKATTIEEVNAIKIQF